MSNEHHAKGRLVHYTRNSYIDGECNAYCEPAMVLDTHPRRDTYELLVFDIRGGTRLAENVARALPPFDDIARPPSWHPIPEE